MSDKHLTVEDVDKQIEAYEASHAKQLGLLPVDLPAKICGYVQLAMPVLKFARAIFFWKPKWQKLIDNIISIETEVCGQS